MSASLMAAELAEAPGAVAALLADGAALDAAVRAIAARPRPFAVVCGRGSSGHAGVYFRYLCETLLGCCVVASAPSIVTAYRRAPRMEGALFVVISQSGRSPDLVAATAQARDAGALTLALVNDGASPVAGAADLVLALRAGPERSVAATKTVIASMAACAALLGRLAGDRALLAALDRLPASLDAALALDWAGWTLLLRGAAAAVVTGRGPGLAAAREIALKLAETLRLPALAYSAAELRHGPRAALGAATPVLALRQDDAVAATVDALAAELAAAGVPLALCGGPRGDLPWLAGLHPVLAPVCMLPPAYRAIEAEARRRCLDPDRPPGLAKVTETL
ncbi:MAG: SIS domain-containing protein [Thalassobaculales bacterium]